MRRAKGLEWIFGECGQRQRQKFLGRSLSESRTRVNFAGLYYPTRQVDESSRALQSARLALTLALTE